MFSKKNYKTFIIFTRVRVNVRIFVRVRVLEPLKLSYRRPAAQTLAQIAGPTVAQPCDLR